MAEPRSYTPSHIMHSPIPVSQTNLTSWIALLDTPNQLRLSYSHSPSEYQMLQAQPYPSAPLSPTPPNGSTNPPTMPVPTPTTALDTSLPSAPTTIKSVIVDHLAKDFELTESQHKHLHLFTELAHLQGGLTMPVRADSHVTHNNASDDFEVMKEALTGEALGKRADK
ncbi:hypothetical protein IW262DRAFT_1454406 [Armillaria fumosa]|nr:hypothetical protein IW262DRAFT_1454406 [Armillaria fumosa]